MPSDLLLNTVPLGSPSSVNWYPDTGATHHVTPDLSALTLANEYKGMDKLLVGDSKGLQIAHVGTSHLSSPLKSLALTDVLHVPHIIKPLLSVRKLCSDNACFFEFDDTHCVIKDKVTKQPLLHGIIDLGLYKLHNMFQSQHKYSAAAFLATLEDWHKRLGLPNY